MSAEQVNAHDASAADVAKTVANAEDARVWGAYTVECIGADGQVKWVETFKNLVVNVGKADMLTNYFTASAYTAAFYLGLVDGSGTPVYNAADTMASHSSWAESVVYSNSTRIVASFGAASASGGGAGSAGTGTMVTSAASFAISGTGGSAVIAGAFLSTNSAKSGTTGTLFSVGAFSGGNRTVVDGDTLNAIYTANN